MDKTKQSEVVRDWLARRIDLVNSTVISPEAKETMVEEFTKLAVFRLAHIWIGDLKYK